MGNIEVFGGIDRRLLIPFEDEVQRLDDLGEASASENSGFDDTIRETGGVPEGKTDPTTPGGKAGGEKILVDDPLFGEKQKRLQQKILEEASDLDYCLNELTNFKDGVKEIVREAFVKAKELSKTKGEETEYSVLPVVDVPGFQTEYDVPLGKLSDYSKIESSVKREMVVIKKKLINLVTDQQYIRWVSGAERGRRIDPKMLARAPLGETNFFKEKRESNVTDVAFYLLVDESGSMGGTKTLEARRCAVMFGSLLASLKVIPFEIAGFTTSSLTTEQRQIAQARGYMGNSYSRTENLKHKMYKRFHESYDAVKTRLVHITAEWENYDQDDLEWAWERTKNFCLQSGISRKVIIVISDGQPCGATAARHKLSRIINEIGCDPYADVIGIGINTNYVKDFYHKAIEINNVSQLGINVARLIESAIRKRR